MKLIVVGTGSSGNAYALEARDEILLLDAGMPLLQVKKKIDWQISKVKGCLITHEHSDHAGYLEQYRKAGIPCYISENTRWRLSEEVAAGSHILEERKKFYIGDFGVSSFQLPHDKTESTGFYISHPEMGTFLYMTDFRFSVYRFIRVNHALVEANYDTNIVNIFDPKYEHVVNGHCSLQTAKEFVGKYAGKHLQNVILCHLSSDNAEPERFKKECEDVVDAGVKVSVAENGKTIGLDIF